MMFSDVVGSWVLPPLLVAKWTATPEGECLSSWAQCLNKAYANSPAGRLDAQLQAERFIWQHKSSYWMLPDSEWDFCVQDTYARG